jgi:hypothetical protein
MFIGKDGSFLDYGRITTPKFKTYYDSSAKFYHNWAGISAYMLAVMNCKNVRIVKGAEPPEGIDRARRRNGKPPLYRYHILQVDKAPGTRVVTESESHTGIKMPLHICRGHFKTYTEEKPLFGKYTGTYWCPPHMKGDAKIGVVDKDYRVKA